MRKVLVIVLLLLILVAVTTVGYMRGRVDYSDQEMYDMACGMYQEHLFEFAIDGTLFMPVVTRNIDDSTKVYRWAAVTPKGDTTGIDVTVARSRKIEPELTLFGPAKAVMALVGTERSKEEWIKK